MLPFLVTFFISVYPALLNHLEVHLWFNQFHAPFFDGIFPIITYLGDGLGWIIFSVLFLFIKYRFGLFIFISGLVSGAITQILKRFVFDEVARPTSFFTQNEIPLVPFVEYHTNFSFPSGHATSAFALFLALSIIVGKKQYQFLFFLLAFLAAFSRIYLHQHFLRDTLAGASIGVMATILMYLIFWEKWKNEPTLNKSLLSFKNKKS